MQKKTKALCLIVLFAVLFTISSTQIKAVSAHFDNLAIIENIQFTDGGSGEITELILANPLGILTDDLLLVVVCSDDNLADVFFNEVTNWTKIDESGDQLCDSHIAAYYQIAEEDGGHEMIVNTTSADNMLGWYMRISGVDITDPIQSFNFAQSGASGTDPHVIPSISTIQGNCLVLYGIAFDGGDGCPFGVAYPFTELAERTNTGTPNEEYVCGSIGYQDKVNSGASGNALVYTSSLDGASYFQIAISGNNEETTTTIDSSGIFYDMFLSTELWGYFGPLALVISGWLITKKEKNLGIFFIIVDFLVMAQYFALVEATPDYWWHIIILLLGVIVCIFQMVDR